MRLGQVFSVLLFLCGGVGLAGDREVSLQAFEKVWQVARSPRCANCHSPYEYPLFEDSGVVHPMNIKRNITKLGQSCTSCHADTGANAIGSPPNAKGWSMPSTAKAFPREMTARYLCDLLKDENRTAFEDAEHVGQKRSREQLIKHVETDELVKWAWKIRDGENTEVPSHPIGTHSEFVQNFRTWIEHGAHCP